MDALSYVYDDGQKQVIRDVALISINGRICSEVGSTDTLTAKSCFATSVDAYGLATIDLFYQFFSKSNPGLPLSSYYIGTTQLQTPCGIQSMIFSSSPFM